MTDRPANTSTNARRRPTTSGDAPSNPLSAPRVDRAHASRLLGSAGDSLLQEESPAAWSDAGENESVRRQAAELAELLRDGQRRLDEREALLNSQQAKLEVDLRRMRLRERERQRELDELESTRKRLIEELHGRATAMAAAEHSVTVDLAESESQVRREEAKVGQLRDRVTRDRHDLNRQSAVLYELQERIQRERADLERERTLAQQEAQLEQTASQAQHRRLLRQAERAAENAEQQRLNAELRSQDILREEDALRQAQERHVVREADLARRDQNLKTQRTRFEALRRQLEQDRATARKQSTELHLERERLQQLTRQLDQRESAVNAQRREIESQRAKSQSIIGELDAHRESLRAAKRDDEGRRESAWSELRHKLDQLQKEQGEWDVERKSQQEALDRRRELLNERERSLERVRDEIRKLHHEALEMRLAAEELFASRSFETLTPQQIRETIPRIRQRIADQFAIEREELLETRETTAKLLDELREQQTEVERTRQSLQRWFERRRTEVEEQAARVIARQHELSQEAKQLDHASAQWDEERLTLQQRIRELIRRQLD